MQDRRSSERVQVDSECNLVIDGITYKGRLIDISDNGVSFMVFNSSPFKLAYQEGTRFTFSQSNGLSGECKIVRIDKFSGLDET